MCLYSFTVESYYSEFDYGEFDFSENTAMVVKVS